MAPPGAALGHQCYAISLCYALLAISASGCGTSPSHSAVGLPAGGYGEGTQEAGRQVTAWASIVAALGSFHPFYTAILRRVKGPTLHARVTMLGRKAGHVADKTELDTLACVSQICRAPCGTGTASCTAKAGTLTATATAPASGAWVYETCWASQRAGGRHTHSKPRSRGSCARQTVIPGHSL